MKILYVIPTLGMGGAERLVCEMLPLLNDSDLRVDLLVFADVHSPLVSTLSRAGIRLLSAGRSKLRGIYDPRNVLVVRRLLPRSDLVHAHLTAAQYAVMLASCLLPGSPPLVATEHSPSNRRFGKWYFRPLDRFLYGRFRRVIAISDDVEREMALRFPACADRLRLIPNGIRMDAYTASCSDDLPLPSSLSLAEKVLIQVAAFRPEKDQDTLIRALSHLPSGVHLLLVGDGVRREQLRSLTDSLGLSSRVH